MSVGDCVALAKRFEGCRLDPYICPAGFWTVGYGHLCSPNSRLITLEQAESYLLEDIHVAMIGVVHYSPILLRPDLDQKLTAITDFTFNLGVARYRSSTLRKRVECEDWGGARSEIVRWCHGGGKVLPGLVIRRHVESLLLR